jgi:hypothetical protein
LVSPNQGKDIGGNLRLIGQWVEDGSPGNIMIVCHSKNRDGGWRRELFAPLFTNYMPYLFKSSASIGMVGARGRLYHRNNDVNSDIYNGYCNRFGFHDKSMHFIAGTMFAVRSSIFKQFFSQFNATALANELEFGEFGEPSKAHSWERLYGAIVNQSRHIIKPVEHCDDVDKDIMASFDETFYLENNPDIKRVVMSNDYSSGLLHYIRYGKNEGRLPCKSGNKRLLML